MLKVKEIFYSLQGEGHYTGRPAIFVRFAGCNLWSGKPEHKARSPCYFCDTDFNNGENMCDEVLSDRVFNLWPECSGTKPFIIFTGGEPTLQLTNKLLSKIIVKFLAVGLHCNFALETNGELECNFSKPVWVTLSPKTKGFKRMTCDELKLLWPLKKLQPEDVSHVTATRRYLQPIYDLNYENNLKSAMAYCLKNPMWSLSLQQHKILNIR